MKQLFGCRTLCSGLKTPNDAKNPVQRPEGMLKRIYIPGQAVLEATVQMVKRWSLQGTAPGDPSSCHAQEVVGSSVSLSGHPARGQTPISVTARRGLELRLFR